MSNVPEEIKRAMEGQVSEQAQTQKPITGEQQYKITVCLRWMHEHQAEYLERCSVKDGDQTSNRVFALNELVKDYENWNIEPPHEIVVDLAAEALGIYL